MEDTNFGSNQGNPGQGGTSKPGGKPPSQKPGQSGDQPGSREESTSSPGQTERQGQKGYEYKGGRQGQSGVPNPDDVDDGESAGSFRGTAELSSESDADQDTESDEELETDTDDDDDDDEVEQSIGADQKRKVDLNSPLRNPK